VWRRLCQALPLSSSTSRFLLLVLRLHAKTPKLSPSVPLTCPRPCFRLPGTHAKHQMCVIRLVCVYRFHCLFAARTAQYSERPVAVTLPHVFDLRNVCVCALCFALFHVKRHFYTQLAPQQIRNFFGCMHQHKIRSVRLPFVHILNRCIVCIIVK